MKRMPPRSRRLCSQPLSRTSVPTSEERSSPQVWDLYRCIVVHPVFADRGACFACNVKPPQAYRAPQDRLPTISPYPWAHRGPSRPDAPYSFGGSLRSPLLTVGQCALVSPCPPWGTFSPPSLPDCGTGTPPRDWSRWTRRRHGCSGCPPNRPRSAEAQVRARLHPVDWNEISGVIQLAVAEGTLGRGAGPDHGRAGPGHPGRPQPLPRLLRPREEGVRGDRLPPGGHRTGAGHLGRAYARSPETGGARGRRSCWTRAGRWPRRGRRRRCCGSRPACRCRASHRTASRCSG